MRALSPSREGGLLPVGQTKETVSGFTQINRLITKIHFYVIKGKFPVSVSTVWAVDFSSFSASNKLDFRHWIKPVSLLVGTFVQNEKWRVSRFRDETWFDEAVLRMNIKYTFWMF